MSGTNQLSGQLQLRQRRFLHAGIMMDQAMKKPPESTMT